ncbi:MAG: NADH-quinone oxidoreductase subunit NuoE [bacterium]
MARLRETHSDRIDRIMGRYPDRRSAIIPLLWEAQRTDGYVTEDSIFEVAELCEVTPTEVMEVITFYTMFNQRPVGKFLLSVCETLSCAICGGVGLVHYLEEKLGIKRGETTSDGLFTIQTVECIGACTEAPAMMINETLYGNLTRSKVDQLLNECRKNAGAAAKI